MLRTATSSKLGTELLPVIVGEPIDDTPVSHLSAGSMCLTDSTTICNTCNVKVFGPFVLDMCAREG